MTVTIGRRELLAALGGAAAAWPLAARAQQRVKLPTIGFLGAGTPSVEGQRVAAFVQRLRELGWIDGRDVVIEYRWAEARNERYAEIATEFARLKVDVIFMLGTLPVIAAKQTIAVIPIVFLVSDPVGSGIVASLARPGGNVTGLSNQLPDTAGKKLELLREVVPGLRRLAIMANVGNPAAALEIGEVQAAARTFDLAVATSQIWRVEDFAPAFEALKGRADALYVCAEPLMNVNRVRINTLALGMRLPTMYGSREYVEAGGLMSYGANMPDLFRRAADYVDKILRGAKPADLLKRRQFITLLGGAAAWPLAARAQRWPSQVVRIICPFAPGGGIDATARIVAARLSEIWRQQVVVENKTGASGNIAGEFAARSDPDGYTIYNATLPHATSRYLYRSLGYDPVADFASVTLIGLYPLMMVVPNSSPAHSVGEFIAYAKVNKLSYASSGHGTSLHLAGELFKWKAGIELTHVPYRGAGPAFNDLIPGRVDAMINFAASSLPLVRQGQLRGLAVASAKRLSVAPDLPTMAEAGVAGVEVSGWSAFLVPAKTPRDIIRQIHDDTVAGLAQPAIRDKLERDTVVVIGSTPDEFDSFLGSEMDKWGRVIKQANISAQ